jgi:hypothetical protein
MPCSRSLLLLAAIGLAGCYKTSVTQISPGGKPGVEVKLWSHALINGLIPLKDVSVADACGDAGVWKVETRLAAGGVAATYVTFGIYTPTTVVVTCKG